MCEFIYDETYGHRVRHWNIEMRQCQEYVLRDPNMVSIWTVYYCIGRSILSHSFLHGIICYERFGLPSVV